jgi:transcription-repair coupling factor (superfamily II helicase)
MSDLFVSPLNELAGFNELLDCLKKGITPVQMSGCTGSQRVHLMYEAGKPYGWRLIVAGNDLTAREIYEDYMQLDERVCYYPAKDLIFYQADLQGSHQMSERLQVLKCLYENKGGTIITTMDGLMNVLPSFDSWKKHVTYVTTAQELDTDRFRRELVRMGYTQTAAVENGGEFSMRGGIIDIFPFTEENPVRIELWGDEVDSIRFFDAQSQRSIGNLEEIYIFPAQELVLTAPELEFGLGKLKKAYDAQYALFKNNQQYEEALNLKENVGTLVEELSGGVMPANMYNLLGYFCQERAGLLDYLPEDTLIYAVEPGQMREKGDAVEAEFMDSCMHRLEKGYILPGQAGLIYKQKVIMDQLGARRTIAVTGLDVKLPEFPVKQRFSVNAQSVSVYKENTQMLIQDLEKWHKGKYRVVILYASRTRAKRMAQYLQEYDLDVFYQEHPENQLLPGQTMITCGKLHKGFAYPYLKFVVLTEADMFGTEKKKKTRKSAYKGTKINSLSDLKVGDYVVHENYGLGIYRGIERRLVDHVSRDYIRVEYGDNSSLFVPATQFEFIQKYASPDKKVEKLNSLYGNEWKKTKTKVKAAVEKVAEELVTLYAARQEQTGYAYGADTLWQQEFEESFPYEETDDQLDAIKAVKQDMESKKIMDRLVCGDVGFGKTEIAIRAAFKAVQEGKQVVYLVPTTILCQQHFNTFRERMKDYPIRVDEMSRFCTPKQMKQTVEDLKKGLVDIVIGTHRVLSKDVEFKDLGLLIIDEEQRFGVTHKEKIKQMKKNVDVLTLTATPIPRTLHMSLIGVRDMSVLEEAPNERLPIQTYVCENSREMVREAIARELARGGQAYYVYNRVSGIAKVAEEIGEMLPQASVAYAHGQMSERELERIMLDFVNGEIDVLVSTTIIETGLDIPNVNTIIIDDADRMGLSQLYQLRGRVGRSNRTAYAFIMYKKDKQLKEEAEKRLMAIREFTELGSGVKIALKDLEIRGAGNLLGHDQHGHMEAVGYDLYCKLLNEAVLRLQGLAKEEEAFETRIEIALDAYIPETYIKNESLLLEMYKRITTIESEEEYEDIQDELIDRFGEPPAPCTNLLMVALLKTLGHGVGVELIRAGAVEAQLVMYPKANIKTEHIEELLNLYHGDLRISTSGKPTFIYYERNPQKRTLESMCIALKTLLNDIKMLLVD